MIDKFYIIQKWVFPIMPVAFTIFGLYGNISDEWTRFTILCMGVGTMLVQYFLWGLENLISTWIVAAHYYFLEKKRMEQDSNVN